MAPETTPLLEPVERPMSRLFTYLRPERGRLWYAISMSAINKVFDVHERRVAAGLRNRVPPTLWATLFLLLPLSMIGIGYFSGIKGARNPIASTGLALSFSLVIFMVADLDRPSSGLMMADRSAITDLEKRISSP